MDRVSVYTCTCTCTCQKHMIGERGRHAHNAAHEIHTCTCIIVAKDMYMYIVEKESQGMGHLSTHLENWGSMLNTLRTGAVC